MPQVNIREIDNTAATAIEYDDYVVLVPITSATEALCDTITGLEAAVPSASRNGSGYAIAKYAINSGLKVLVVPYDTAANALSKYTDKALYDIRFMTLGDALEDTNNVAAFAVMLAVAAATRGDSVAIIDIPKAQQTTTAAILSWVDTLNLGTVNRAPDTLTGKVVTENVENYCSFFAPFVKFKDNGVELANSVPSSIIYLNCFASNKSTYPDWFAMAGSVRGVSKFLTVKPDVEFGDADVAELQRRTYVEGKNTRQVNPICRVRPYGYIVWGNRTGYALTSAQPNLKASSFLNIRHLCCDIKNRLYRASRKFTFEPNSDILWANFVAEIKPLLEEMRTGQGILGYQIIKEKTLQKATLKARIRIIPIEAVEDFDLTVEMTDSIVEVNG